MTEKETNELRKRLAAKDFFFSNQLETKIIKSDLFVKKKQTKCQIEPVLH